VVGAPIANRTYGELEPLIGFFVNTLALRGRLSCDLTFRDLLHQLRETTLGAYQRQDLPFEKLVEELRPERSLSHTPVFQVAMALQNAGMGVLDIPGIQLSAVGQQTVTAKFDLLLNILESGGGLQLYAEYSTELFESETIKRMLSHFATLLQSIVAEPDARISQINFLSASENLLVEVTTSIEELDQGFAFETRADGNRN